MIVLITIITTILVIRKCLDAKRKPRIKASMEANSSYGIVHKNTDNEDDVERSYTYSYPDMSFMSGVNVDPVGGSGPYWQEITINKTMADFANRRVDNEEDIYSYII